MLDVQQLASPGFGALGNVFFAKFRPDDDTPGGPPGMGGGGGFDPGDGNFKKGRVSPVAILVGIVIVVVLAVFLVVGFKKDAERLTVEQAEAEKKAILVLPSREEQLTRWRAWAASEQSIELRAEALKQLGIAKDPAGVQLAAQALSSPVEPIQAMAAIVIASYGKDGAAPARPALLEALKKADSGAKPQIVWALVEAGEPAALEEVLTLYRAGHLAKVQRLGGGTAFDTRKLVALIGIDKLATMSKDTSEAVRQLVATVLSEDGNAKWTDTLVQLVRDKSLPVSLQAAPGLGRIGSESARAPLLEALKKSDRENRTKYLEALRDGIGTAGLVLALDTISSDDPSMAWYQRQQIMDMIEGTGKKGEEGLNDPRGGDSLLKIIESKPHPHWQFRAARAMAKIGDIRGIPTLAKHLRMNPAKIYSDDIDYEMLIKRDGTEREEAARMIADLAVLYPDKRPWIREQAEDAVISWNHERKQPHGNGLRALVAMESTADLDQLRKWAHPEAPLPKEGEKVYSEEWSIAQTAMRYVGWAKDEKSRKWIFDEALNQRPADTDVTMDGLYAGGLAVLGMTLKGIGEGASDAISEWRDPAGFKPLMEYIEDPQENDQSRLKACMALAWVASEQDMVTVAEKIQKYSGPEKPDAIRRACFLETLITRPVKGTGSALLAMLERETDPSTRHQVARALGKAGLTDETKAKLFEMLSKDSLMLDAALALLLGGTPDDAARAVANFADKDKAAVDELQELWYRSFGYWSVEDLELGRIFRWVDNAKAVARVELRVTPQLWAIGQLMSQFDTLQFDNGPHSFTRVVLRVRLMQMAEGNDPALRAGAIETLKFMKERGVIMALAQKEGETGKLAQAAKFELMNPLFMDGVKDFAPADEKK